MAAPRASLAEDQIQTTTTTTQETVTTQTTGPAAPPALPEPTPHALSYTLHDAFSVLREALATYYEQADNMPLYLQAQETQMLYDNGGHGAVDHPNCQKAWQQLVPLLEQAIKAPVRIT